MVVRIRLARFGRVNQPFYNIVVSQARYASSNTPPISCDSEQSARLDGDDDDDGNGAWEEENEALRRG